MENKNSTYLDNYKNLHDKNLHKGISGFVRKLIDKKAKKLNQHNRHSLFFYRQLNYFNLLANIENSKIKVLDIGCANGAMISYAHPNIKYYGIDKGCNYQQKLQQNNIEFLSQDVDGHKINYPDNHFDIITLNHLIEHISNPEKLIEEASRLLKTNGKLLIRTPDILKQKFKFYNDYTHIRPFTSSSLINLAKSHGFNCIKIHHSNSAIINLDILSNFKLSKLLCNSYIGGTEIEAYFIKK